MLAQVTWCDFPILIASSKTSTSEIILEDCCAIVGAMGLVTFDGVYAKKAHCFDPKDKLVGALQFPLRAHFKNT